MTTEYVRAERLDRDDSPASDAAAAFALLIKPAWHAEAACRGLPSAWFFPERGDPTDAAKRVCADCPVSAPCLDYALERGEKFGIWGGESERSRRVLRRSLRKPKPAPQEVEPLTFRQWRKTAPAEALYRERRDLLLLLYLDGLRPREIAEACRIDPGTVEAELRKTGVKARYKLA